MFDHGGKKYLVHRAIFLLTNGYLPEMVDHKDQDKVNNLPENLREATRSENSMNTGVRKDNTTGVKGVSPKGSKFEVRYKGEYLGVRDTLEEATLLRQERDNNP